ncbi:MAG: ATP-binding cassette domain-containing protein [Candidatus Marinimicrobia bacterium]|nr:ATP-binding cassette domain-containing protein [Candidatus Neomarinimicrobiota bacterium]
MIEVKNLFYAYTKHGDYAVNDISFDIKKGEIFGFLGPSGAGKSTTQGVLSGLLKLQKGSVVIDGKAREDQPDKDFFNRIGVGFERPNVYKKLSGYDNLKFHASLYDGETEDPMTVLQRVGLAEEGRKKPAPIPRE